MIKLHKIFSTAITFGFLLFITACGGANNPSKSTDSSGSLVTGTSMTRALSAPRFLSAKTAEDSQVTLEWEAPMYGVATQYKIYRSTTPGAVANGALLETVSGTTLNYLDEDVTNGTTYYYRVTALRNSESSVDSSNEAEAKPWSPGAARDTSNLFVDFAASPGGDGSFALPYQTISAAHTAAASGGTINIFDGTSATTTALYITKPLTVRSLTGNYRNSDVNISHHLNWNASVNGVRIFGIKNNGGRFLPGNYSTGWNLSMNLYTNTSTTPLHMPLTTSQWIIYGNQVDSIVAGSNSGFNLWRSVNCDCYFVANTIIGPPLNGISVYQSTDITIKENVVRNAGMNGIRIGGGTPVAGDIRIYDNIIDGAGVSDTNNYIGAIALFAPETFSGPVLIEGNHIKNSSVHGLTTSGALDSGADPLNDVSGITLTIEKNIFENHSGYAIEHSGPSILDAPNNYWNDSSGPQNAINNPTGSGEAITNFVSFDPILKESY